jgi:hypothetical protein
MTGPVKAVFRVNLRIAIWIAQDHALLLVASIIPHVMIAFHVSLLKEQDCALVFLTQELMLPSLKHPLMDTVVDTTDIMMLKKHQNQMDTMMTMTTEETAEEMRKTEEEMMK